MTQAVPITIDALLKERRVIDPPEEFRRRALVQDEAIYREAERDLEGFWAREAERLTWYRGWTQVLKWDPPWAKWFLGGRLNISSTHPRLSESTGRPNPFGSMRLSRQIHTSNLSFTISAE